MAIRINTLIFTSSTIFFFLFCNEQWVSDFFSSQIFVLFILVSISKSEVPQSVLIKYGFANSQVPEISLSLSRHREPSVRSSRFVHVLSICVGADRKKIGVAVIRTLTP